jgi:hypothetical protein
VQTFLALANVLRESAIDMHTHALPIGTETDESGLTEATLATRVLEGFRAHSVSFFELGNLLAHFDDDTGHLVP